MKNIPRIFIDGELKSGATVLVTRDISHYLVRVMRTRECLVFGGGNEFYATLAADDSGVIIGEKTAHADPSNNLTLYFSPIKRTDDLINMATQMGVARFQPVITARTVNHHVNWARAKKIATEAAEQSNRNSVPEILPPVNFAELDLDGICFADERFAYENKTEPEIPSNVRGVLVGPEGGFSDSEFAAFDASRAVPISLGKTILRAEVAAVIAVGKVLK